MRLTRVMPEGVPDFRLLYCLQCAIECDVLLLSDMASMSASCSVRLSGLQHSLFEHPVKVEITAPSDRSEPNCL